MADTPIAQPSAPVVPVVEQAPVPQQPPQRNPADEAMARKERQLYKQMKDLKAREEAIRAQEERYKSNDYIPRKRFEEDPLATLQDLGYDYTKLTERALQEPNSNDPTIRALMGKINALEERLGASTKSQEEAQKHQYEQVQHQMLADAKDFTADNPEYELINKWGVHNLITDKIESEFERTEKQFGKGIIISMEKAAKMVEDNLMKETLRALEFNKIKNYKRPQAQQDSSVPGQQQTQQAPGQPPKHVPKKTLPYKVESVRTLTNTLSQDTPSKSKDSDADRKRRAIAAYNGTKVE